MRHLHEQLAAEDFSFLLASGTWEEIVADIARDASGPDLSGVRAGGTGPERVRADYLLAEVDGVVVGRVSIRHGLTDHLRRVGGHVGYAVGPQFRRRGYATEILRQSVERLRAEGVRWVLVTCDDDNAGSRRTIEACGGVLEDIVDAGDRRKRRYWIDSTGIDPAG